MSVISEAGARYVCVMRRALCIAIALAALGALAPAANAGLARAERRQISQAVDTFVVHAVRRQHPELAYHVVSPALRAGTTRADWAHSRDLPVYPYPAKGRHFGWHLQYVESHEVGASLLLHPTRRARKMVSIMFDLRLVKYRGKWVVDTLIPAATFAPANHPKVLSVRDFSPQPQAGPPHDRSRLSHAYAVIPFAILGALVAALAAWGLVRWHRDRRLMRGYRHTLPQLPPTALQPPSIPADDSRARPSH
jgi:hypothetical protein